MRGPFFGRFSILEQNLRESLESAAAFSNRKKAEKQNVAKLFPARMDISTLNSTPPLPGKRDKPIALDEIFSFLTPFSSPVFFIPSGDWIGDR